MNDEQSPSNAGRWAPWYAGLPADAQPQPYGQSDSYRIGAQWLGDRHVQDWGCGLGWARQFYEPQLYFGIDGTASPFADLVCDLAEYQSPGSQGIFMRGAIEHDYRWKDILANAVRSFTERMCLVPFTPMSVGVRGPQQQAFVQEIGVPDLSFSHRDIAEVIGEDIATVSFEICSPGTGYGVETLFLLEKP